MSVVLTPASRSSSTVVKVKNPLCTSTEPTFELSNHRKLAYSCGPSSTIAVQVARKARLVSCMRDTSLGLWRILRRQSSSAAELLESGVQELADGGWEKVLDMEFNVQTNLVASAISDNGRWLVVSDMHDVKLFMMEDDVSTVYKKFD
jgi:U3 small nucleolar RNA-associated protein 4